MTRSVERGVAHLRSFVAAPVRLQTYRNLLYVSLAFPLGLAYLLFVSVGVALSLGLLVVLVGVPLLGVVMAIALALAGFERRLATFLLDVDLEPTDRLDGDGPREYLVSVATDPGTWTALVYLATKVLFGMAALFLALTVLTTGISMLFVPLYYGQPGLYVGVVTDRPVELHHALYLGWNDLLVGVEAVVSVRAWRVRTLGDATLVALAGAAVTLVGLNLLNGLARLSGWWTRLALGRTVDVVGLAWRSLGE